jgi:hypothetical protein
VSLRSHRFKANRQGVLSVPIRCNWTAVCRGWFEGAEAAPQAPPRDHLPGPIIAVSQFAIPAGQTRTIRIALTKHGRKFLTRHHEWQFLIELWVSRSNRQLVWTGPDLIQAKLIAPGR